MWLWHILSAGAPLWLWLRLLAPEPGTWATLSNGPLLFITISLNCKGNVSGKCGSSQTNVEKKIIWLWYIFSFQMIYAAVSSGLAWQVLWTSHPWNIYFRDPTIPLWSCSPFPLAHLCSNTWSCVNIYKGIAWVHSTIWGLEKGRILSLRVCNYFPDGLC